MQKGSDHSHFATAQPGPGSGDQDVTGEETAVILENDLYERTFRRQAP